MSEYTTGPWHKGHEDDGGMLAPKFWVYSRENTPLALAVGGGFLSDGESEANARLIAAAPDLLETMERIQRLAVSDDTGPMAKKMLKRIMPICIEAIAKAKGQ